MTFVVFRYHTHRAAFCSWLITHQVWINHVWHVGTSHNGTGMSLVSTHQGCKTHTPTQRDLVVWQSLLVWCLLWCHQTCSMSPHSQPTKQETNVGLMLGQRRRRWVNINPTLVQCLMFAGSQHTLLVQCCLNRGSASATLAHHWDNVDPVFL